jgi:hypothetical protein
VDGESGWDVFMLGYTVRAPLSSVITLGHVTAYARLFRLLWALRGTAHGLGVVGAAARTSAKAASAGRPSTLYAPPIATGVAAAAAGGASAGAAAAAAGHGGVRRPSPPGSAPLGPIPELDGVNHVTWALHREMAHFLSELQYYLVFEVRTHALGTRSRR